MHLLPEIPCITACLFLPTFFYRYILVIWVLLSFWINLEAYSISVTGRSAQWRPSVLQDTPFEAWGRFADRTQRLAFFTSQPWSPWPRLRRSLLLFFNLTSELSFGNTSRQFNCSFFPFEHYRIFIYFKSKSIYFSMLISKWVSLGFIREPVHQSSYNSFTIVMQIHISPG